MELSEIIETLTAYVITVGEKVDEMPGTYAFGMGLATWFIVEQILRRIASAMRWVILIGAVVGLGMSFPQIADFVSGATGTTTPSVPQG